MRLISNLIIRANKFEKKRKTLLTVYSQTVPTNKYSMIKMSDAAFLFEAIKLNVAHKLIAP